MPFERSVQLFPKVNQSKLEHLQRCLRAAEAKGEVTVVLHYATTQEGRLWKHDVYRDLVVAVSANSQFSLTEFCNGFLKELGEASEDRWYWIQEKYETAVDQRNRAA